MSVRNAVFVDVDSLNVLFKIEDKFVAAVCFSENIDRLGEALVAFGTSYDVYLCMKPRAVGEGDIVVDELSMSGLPFTANREELRSVLGFFRNAAGVNEVYLCNWLHNFIEAARVSSFESAIYYGNRVAHMVVRDKLLEQFTLYADQRAFSNVNGENSSAYGDVGLLDVDSFKAQYPELRTGMKVQVTAIAPLVQCYKTQMKLSTDDLFDKLQSVENTSPIDDCESAFLHSHAEKARILTKAGESNPSAETKVVEGDNIAPPTPVSAATLVKQRKPAPKVFYALTAVATVLSLLLGTTAGIVTKHQPVPVSDTYFAEAEERIAALYELEKVYSRENLAVKSETAYNYCGASELDVTLEGFECCDEICVVRCASASEDTLTLFADYIAKRYSVLSTNNLGATAANGSVMYQFSVMFV